VAFLFPLPVHSFLSKPACLTQFPCVNQNISPQTSFRPVPLPAAKRSEPPAASPGFPQPCKPAPRPRGSRGRASPGAPGSRDPNRPHRAARASGDGKLVVGSAPGLRAATHPGPAFTHLSVRLRLRPPGWLELAAGFVNPPLPRQGTVKWGERSSFAPASQAGDQPAGFPPGT